MDTYWKSVEDQIDKLEKTQQEMFEWLKKKIGERGILGPVPGVTVQPPSSVGDSMENMSEEVPSLMQPRKEGFLPWFLNPRFDLPILSNQNPRNWLSRCEEYFSEYKIESCKWVQLASPNLDGGAKEWFDGWVLQSTEVNWKRFSESLCERFESKSNSCILVEGFENVESEVVCVVESGVADDLCDLEGEKQVGLEGNSILGRVVVHEIEDIVHEEPDDDMNSEMMLPISRTLRLETERRTEVCKYLVEDLRLDVDTKDEEGDTPLLHAAIQGHTATAKYLLEHSANPCISNNFEATALYHSASVENMELLHELVSRGVLIDSQSDVGSPLMYAASHGQVDATKALLEYHANLNAETEEGTTLLVSAVAAGSLECIELLVLAGANVNFTSGGATLLHVVANFGNMDNLNFLLKAGADVNITAGGSTALHIAAYTGTIEVLNCLIKAGADPNIKDEVGQISIQIAAERSHSAAVEILFLLTSKVESISEWNIPGIIRHMQSGTKEDSRKVNNVAQENTEPKKVLPEISPEAKRKAAEAMSLFSNRSLCWIRMGQAKQALEDAKSGKELRPDRAKACYREGAALRLLQKFDEAANSFYERAQLITLASIYGCGLDFVEDRKESTMPMRFHCSNFNVP